MKQWLSELMDLGLVPYVATSKAFVPHLDLSLFEGHEVVKLLEDPKERNFHEAYLVSNSLGFGNPELKMPNWVYIDCVLMQSAVIGFALPISKAPDSLISFYEDDPYVEINALDYIPVSGQIAALGIDGQMLTGFSLFSLRRQLASMNIPKLAAFTKFAALHVYKAEEKIKFTGLSQYDNKALKTHALFGEKMYIDQTIMPLHPLNEMSFTYSMKVTLNESRLSGEFLKQEDEYDFLLKSDDTVTKQGMQNRIDSGERFYITSPIHIEKEDGLYLPICLEK
ncbi:MAG: hypothetical protein CMH31_02235 [Micavibrio sp.]|nr:hypothetical protein [Micavibrio sp.]|tara:strand:- start:439 stop:1281 length:843 start_codon:yes stop_codon:yes gene_type:complete